MSYRVSSCTSGARYHRYSHSPSLPSSSSSSSSSSVRRILIRSGSQPRLCVHQRLEGRGRAMWLLRAMSSDNSENEPAGDKSQKKIDEERLRIMRELVERDTNRDSAIMKKLADEFVALTSPSETDTSGSTPIPAAPVAAAPLNSIEQAALLEDLFNRNYRQELEDIASVSQEDYLAKKNSMKKKREEFEKKKGKLLEAIQTAINDAQEVCEVDPINSNGDSSNNNKSEDMVGAGNGGQCAAAWDEAEELQAELSRQKMKYSQYKDSQ